MTADALLGSTWEVQVAGQRHAAKVSLKPLYDPSSSRVKA
jgi:glycine cleavage system aminomethyltransferase T